MSSRIISSITAAVVVGACAVAAVDMVTGTAEAQSGTTITKAQLMANQRISSAAVARSNRALNYLAPIRTDATDKADDGTSGVKALSAIVGSGRGWTSAQIADLAIISNKIADSAVITAKIANGAVTNAKLGDASVTTTKLADNSVSTNKIGAKQVTGAKLADDSVGEAQIGSAQVGVNELKPEVLGLLPSWATKTDNGASITTDNTFTSATDVTVTSAGVGVYRVVLGTNGISGCAVTASLSGQDGVVPAGRSIITALAADEKTVTVRTFTADGTTAVDSAFAVQAAC